MKKPDHLIKTARRLRVNQTDAERILWHVLRSNKTGFKFRRQHPIGSYIADFICVKKSLIIELDGGHHTAEKDRLRTEYLNDHHYTIIRFWNDEVRKNLEAVYRMIEYHLHKPN